MRAINGITSDIINYGHPQTGVEPGIIKVLMTNESKQLAVTSMRTAGAFNLFSHSALNEEVMSKFFKGHITRGLGLSVEQQMLTGLPASSWNIKTVTSSRFTLILNNWYR